MTTSTASLSSLSGGGEYSCANQWPDECYLQCGRTGIVFTKAGSYRTAFFEAFPKSPSTFIRGEGRDLQAAEADAWAKWQKITQCPGHEFERRGYKNGLGFCQHCGMSFSRAFEPEHICVICQTPTDHATDINGNHYCEQHASLIPEDKRDNILAALARVIDSDPKEGPSS